MLDGQHRMQAHPPPSPVRRRLLYWTAADGAARREAYDALSDAILCLGSSSSSRWTAQAAALRRVQAAAADDLPSVRAAGSEVSLHRVSLSDEPDQLFLLSRWDQRRMTQPQMLDLPASHAPIPLSPRSRCRLRTAAPPLRCLQGCQAGAAGGRRHAGLPGPPGAVQGPRLGAAGGRAACGGRLPHQPGARGAGGLLAGRQASRQAGSVSYIRMVMCSTNLSNGPSAADARMLHHLPMLHPPAPVHCHCAGAAAELPGPGGGSVLPAAGRCGTGRAHAAGGAGGGSHSWGIPAPAPSPCLHPLHAPQPPCPQDLAEVLQEAAEAAGGKLRRVAEGTSAFQLPPVFGPRHRAAQHVQLMAQLQEQAG